MWAVVTFLALSKHASLLWHHCGRAAVVSFRLLVPQVGRGNILRAHYRRNIMHRLIFAICLLILGTCFVLSFAQAAEKAQKNLQGSWTATKAERDGKAADDVVGNRLSFTGNR